MKQALEVEVKIGADYVTRQSIDLGGEGREMLSPYDVPKSARIWYDDQQKQLNLEFKYLTPNEPRVPFEIGRIEFKIGKMSKKLYAFTVYNVNPTIEGMKSAFEEITQALESQRRQFDVRQLKQRTPYWNFSLAKDFLQEERDDLLSLAY